jgi:sugar/nucleoside kinase (ribokinase family)
VNGHGLTVVGNLAVDRVDGRPASAGGCPSFAAAAFDQMGVGGRIVTKRAPRDAELFTAMLAAIAVPTLVLDAQTTSGFELNYDGEQRSLTVAALGDPWTVDGLELAAIDTTWVHVAPLLRSDFPAETIAALARSGHRVSFDGQGLVRVPELGAMRTDNGYDPLILSSLAALKLADDEAEVVAGGREFTQADAARLGVPEILVTFGSAGADVYLDAVRTHVSSNRSVQGVHTTGSGDIFAVAYAAARAAGTEPIAAAQAACGLVADVLERRAGH